MSADERLDSERLGALEGLQRSILILRANWELILLSGLQTAVAVCLSIVSLVPFYFVLDVRLPALDATPEESAAWVTDSLIRVYEQLDSPAFWLAVISSSALLVAMVACYSFFQAGVFGVLTNADRSGAAARFRSYRWAEFQRLGGRQLWPFFWLFNLVLLFWLLCTLLATLALLAVGLAAGAGGLGAGFAVGCAAVFPLGLLFVLLVFGGLFGQAVVAASDCGPWDGLKTGFRLLMRRLGAVVLLFIVMAAASLAIVMFFLVLSLPLGSSLLASGGLRVFATILLQGMQWLVTGVLQLIVAGAVVAITRGESDLEERDRVVVAS